MTSINYNAASASAVRILQSVGRDLATTQNRIATGYKVNSASDNADVWKAASSLRSDIKAYDTANASMDYAKGIYAVASKSADAVVDIINEIKTLISTNAGATGTALATAETRLGELQKQLQGAVEDGNAGGLNLLKGGTMPSIITSFSSSGSVTTDTPVTTKNLLGTTAGLLNEVVAASYGASKTLLTTTIAEMQAVTGGVTVGLGTIQTALSGVADYAGALGAASKSVESSQALMSKLADIKKSALSSLVDADLEQESAKLAALQVKQQLATQALSIANQSNQSILRLFQ